MKRYCIKDRKRYKREQLNVLCVGCKHSNCHLWYDYNGDKDIPEDIINSNIVNLDEIQKVKLRLDVGKIIPKS